MIVLKVFRWGRGGRTSLYILFTMCGSDGMIARFGHSVGLRTPEKRQEHYYLFETPMQG